MIALPTVGVLGTGAVGQAVAGALVASGLCGELLIASRTHAQTEALAADLDDMRTALGSPARPRACRPADLTTCHAVVVAARAHFTNTHHRDVRMGGATANAPIIRRIGHQVLRGYPGVVLVVTNPVDLMTRLLAEACGGTRVFGIGSSLDTARYRLLLAHHLAVPVEQIHGHVIGEHGDAAVICASSTTVAGHPAAVPVETIRAALAARPGRISAGIGRTRTGPAGAVLAALRHLLGDAPGVIELSRPWRGGVWLGLPLAVKAGVPTIRLPELSPQETAELDAAAAKLATAYHHLTSTPTPAQERTS
ncbi:lactate/malate family dehydrogenase [Streptomyces megasporus]|uniref:lactate/malate family dehydrogenase n=1 Tax=Streptomyces megasporus TaxID=44060 RepID=UPI0004E14CCE|nr:NAD(P)-binding domain-containing protein [Streptomyces megasporus]